MFDGSQHQSGAGDLFPSPYTPTPTVQRSAPSKTDDSLVWRLRARLVYAKATASGDREAAISRAWLESALEISEGLTSDDLAKFLAKASGGKMRVKADKSGGLVVTLEAAVPIADVRRVFECWKVTTGKTKAILDRAREQRIRARLRDGYTVERLEAAIRGAMKDAFLCGENDRGKTYLDLSTIFRDGPQVERLEALAINQDRKSGSVFRRVKS